MMFLWDVVIILFIRCVWSPLMKLFACIRMYHLVLYFKIEWCDNSSSVAYFSAEETHLHAWIGVQGFGVSLLGAGSRFATKLRYWLDAWFTEVGDHEAELGDTQHLTAGLTPAWLSRTGEGNGIDTCQVCHRGQVARRGCLSVWPQQNIVSLSQG